LQSDRVHPIPHAANRRILPCPPQKLGRTRRRGCGVAATAAAAEGRAYADVASTAGLDGADLARRTVGAVVAVGESRARRAAVDAVAS
jgi:hypothetical protein